MTAVEKMLYTLGTDLTEYILQFRKDMYIQEKITEFRRLYDKYLEKKVQYVFNSMDSRIKHLLSLCISERLGYIQDLYEMSTSFISILDFSNAFLQLGGQLLPDYIHIKTLLSEEENRLNVFKEDVFSRDKFWNKCIKTLQSINDDAERRKKITIEYITDKIICLEEQCDMFDVLLAQVELTSKLKLKMFQLMLKFIYIKTHSWSFFLREVLFLVDLRLKTVRVNLDDNYDAYRHFMSLN